MAKKTTRKKTTRSKQPASPKAGTRSPRPGTKLLRGGNPQIAKADGPAPVRAYLDAMPGWKREVGRRLDAIIERAAPGVRKAVKWNSPFYGAPDPERGWFLAMHCFTHYVKVTFFNGVLLAPPPPRGSASGNARSLDIREGEALDEKQLAEWVRQAAAQPGWAP